MHIPFSKTKKISTKEGSIWDYLVNDEVGIAYQQLTMRGPKSGRYLNKVCHEIYFIIEGTATFYVGKEIYQVKQKDVVVVLPNTPHYIETSDLKYITITRPDWYEDQYEQVS